MDKHSGFTLVEVMVVVIIMGILAMVGIPAYNNYVTRGKVVDATSELSNGRIRLEQFFQDNRTYVGGVCPAATRYFGFVCTLNAATYTITANGIGNMAAYHYTINEATARTSTTPWSGGAQVNCWIMRDGDSC